MKLERKKMMLELFEDDDSPIRRLPYDCLLMIFRYCPLATLISLSNVNHSWRKITQNSSLVHTYASMKQKKKKKKKKERKRLILLLHLILHSGKIQRFLGLPFNS